jgi:hypothetical protein
MCTLPEREMQLIFFGEYELDYKDLKEAFFLYETGIQETSV